MTTLDTNLIFKIFKFDCLPSNVIDMRRALWIKHNWWNYFNSYERVSSIAETFGDNIEVCVLFLNGEILALVSVCKKTRYRILWRSFVWGRFFDKSGLLYVDYKYLTILTQRMIYAWLHLFFEEIDNGEYIVMKELGWIQRESSINYMIDISKRSIYNPNKSLRKKLSKVQRRYCLVLERYVWDDLIVNIDTIFHIEKLSNKSLKRRSLFDKEKIVNLFKNIVRKGWNNKVIYFLKYEQEIIAYDFGFECWWLYMSYNSSFVDQYKSLSPWNILQLMMLDNLWHNGSVSIYDFSRWYTMQKYMFSNNNFYYKYGAFLSKNKVISYYVYLIILFQSILRWFKNLLKKLLHLWKHKNH